jgi:2-amino-4-hydroxy-6-hydroxymethyldihydropteridine diphosphokinase
MAMDGAMKYYLGLGANIGDPAENLAETRARLEKNGVRILAASSLYRTEPVGRPGQPWFLNQAIAVESGLTPLKLLNLAKRIERDLGRRSGPRNGPRPIDIDILLAGEVLVRGKRLTIPHPRMADRNFVLAPLAEIAPDAVHPVFFETIATLRRRSKDSARIVRLRTRP